jgi:hypothetical protein
MQCSEETKVLFPDQILYRFQPLPSIESLKLEARECFHEEGPRLRVKKECLGARG